VLVVDRRVIPPPMRATTPSSTHRGRRSATARDLDRLRLGSRRGAGLLVAEESLSGSEARSHAAVTGPSSQRDACAGMGAPKRSQVRGVVR
jgi:hypothetical protein